MSSYRIMLILKEGLVSQTMKKKVVFVFDTLLDSLDDDP
jgi:hypothetical protein